MIYFLPPIHEGSITAVTPDELYDDFASDTAVVANHRERMQDAVQRMNDAQHNAIRLFVDGEPVQSANTHNEEILQTGNIGQLFSRHSNQ